MIPQLSALELQQIPRPFDDPDWLFEIKYDGFRSLAQIEHGVCRLISRKDNIYKRFTDLAKAIPADLTTDEAVLDGEIVVLDSEGKSLFYELMHTRAVPIFAAFDLLWVNGADLRDQPLLERKRRLRKFVRKRARRMMYVDHITQNGKAMFAEICRRDMEGIVAKPAISPYKKVRGESPWIKIKNPAYTQKEGRGEIFNRGR
jgi:bifunctional non-homologous end joining protein LigD